jgi:asparagine synthase (glutamine-hydrolysing)
MCGICASTADARGLAVARMTATMVHRGPDDSGLHVDSRDAVALGARRLSIIDLANGHQPVTDEAGATWAVLNGEIYNHPALQKRLRARGHTLASATDTEVLVHLYEDFGDDLVHALEGMFAFIVWDSTRRRLIAARDRFGEKPLFYVQDGGRLVLASELTALLAAGGVDHQLDPRAIDDFFVFGYVPGPASIVREVRQLPPGHLLVWDAGSGELDVRPYWTPPALDAQTLDGSADIPAEAQRLLEKSIATRLIADVPVGVFLSGGLDSTLATALAVRASSRQVRTFSVGYDVGTVNETTIARETAGRLGTEHHEVVLRSADVGAMVADVFRRIDQPVADPALVALHAVAAHARSEVTVAIGGEGADELFGGYPRYRWLARAGEAERLLPRRAAEPLASALRGTAPNPRSRRIADVLGPATMLERHLDWVTAGRRHERGNLYGPLLRSHGLHERDAISLLPDPQRNGTHIGGAYMTLDQRHWLPDDVLAKADRATMLCSLEMRTPFLHHELAEFAAAIPVDYHLKRRGKRVLRDVYDRLDVPPSGHLRKRAFGVPVAEWLRGPLAPLLREQVQIGRLYGEGWFDRRATRDLVEAHVGGSADHGSILWPLLALGMWLDARPAGL